MKFPQEYLATRGPAQLKNRACVAVPYLDEQARCGLKLARRCRSMN